MAHPVYGLSLLGIRSPLGVAISTAVKKLFHGVNSVTESGLFKQAVLILIPFSHATPGIFTSAPDRCTSFFAPFASKKTIKSDVFTPF
jgi:hypothetical protein